MKLPNAVNAIIDLRKLVDYCLNPDHAIGKHKARVFESTLGLTSHDAEQLRLALLGAAQREEAALGEYDDYGQRFTVDFVMKTETGEAIVRSGWIILNDEDFPRLTTCYIK